MDHDFLKQTIEKINNYLTNEDVIHPLFIDVQNYDELESLENAFIMPKNTMLSANSAEFCKPDFYPNFSLLYNKLEKLEKKDENYFLFGISTFFKLKGREYLIQNLSELINTSIKVHLVVFTYQCAQYLLELIERDNRLKDWVIFTNPIKFVYEKTHLYFVKPEFCIGTLQYVDGISNFAEEIERTQPKDLYIKTNKKSALYSNSLFGVTDITTAYEALCLLDNDTRKLSPSLGTVEQWGYAFNDFKVYKSWGNLILSKIGDIKSLAAIFHKCFSSADKNIIWLYFIALKLYQIDRNLDNYLYLVIQNSDSVDDFIWQIYYSIFKYKPTNHFIDDDFIQIYKQRKQLLKDLGDYKNIDLMRFCNHVEGQKENALYYLTDNTRQEKELIIKTINKYRIHFNQDSLIKILNLIYPDLANYLEPYHFVLKQGYELLDDYFKQYKYQKVLNYIDSEFIELVEKQAKEREYNKILQPRSAILQTLQYEDSIVYFIDGMGVEYLSFISSKCKNLKLSQDVSICRCDLPSITSINKVFLDALPKQQHDEVISEKGLDNIKHNKNNITNNDYKNFSIYVIDELEFFNDILNKIKGILSSGKYKKVIIIPDHGASRLAVLYDTDNKIEMQEKGQHSGRCCPISSENNLIDKPEFATESNGFYCLANYERFKGSRKAEIEVHGGASLEEVVIPIIEMSNQINMVEVKIMPEDGIPDYTRNGTEITVSYKKKATVKLYFTQKVKNVYVKVEGCIYNAEPIEDGYYIVRNMKNVNQSRTYYLDVYAGSGMLVEGNIPLVVRKESAVERDLF